MGLLNGFMGKFRTWDSNSKLAFAIAFGLLIVTIIVLSTVPDLRTYTAFGIVGLVIAMQVIWMWANRNMVTSLAQAQQYYLRDDFVSCRDTLLKWFGSLSQKGKIPTLEAQVLLANTYRNLGQFKESENILTDVFDIDERAHFAAYSYAKLYLVTGYYGDAAQFFLEALEYGAPAHVNFDAAHAYYRDGDTANARAILKKLTPSDEPARELFIAYMRHQLDNAPAPTANLINAGLSYWETEAQRFASTDYGRDLTQDIENIRKLF